MGMGITHTLGLWTHSTGVATKWLMGVTCRPQSCVRFNKQDYWFVFCQSQCATTTLLFVVEVVGPSFRIYRESHSQSHYRIFCFDLLSLLLLYFIFYIYSGKYCPARARAHFFSFPYPMGKYISKNILLKRLEDKDPFMASHFRISNWKQVGHVMHS